MIAAGCAGRDPNRLWLVGQQVDRFDLVCDVQVRAVDALTHRLEIAGRQQNQRRKNESSTKAATGRWIPVQLAEPYHKLSQIPAVSMSLIVCATVAPPQDRYLAIVYDRNKLVT